MIDADQARICRSIPEALNADDTRIEETALAPVSGADALKLSYRIRTAAGTAPRWIICRFAGRTGAARATLIGVDTERGPLSEVRFHILSRWWVNAEPTGATASPAEPSRGATWLQQVLNAVVRAGMYGLVATGFALIHGLFGRIHLAFGEIAVAGGVYMLVAVGLSATLAPFGIGGLLLALLAGIVAAAVLSWLIGRMVVTPLATRPGAGQSVLIATLALAIVLAEALRLTAPLRVNWLPPLLNLPLVLELPRGATLALTLAQLGAAWLSLGGAVTLLWLITATRFGRNWRAHADDPVMAGLIGVHIPRLRDASFLLAGAAAGLAGAVSVIAYGTVLPGEGLAITLKALISAIIGGIGSVPGAFLGAALVAGVEIGWSAQFDIAYRDLVTYALLVLFLVLRPGGLINIAAPRPRDI